MLAANKLDKNSQTLTDNESSTTGSQPQPRPGSTSTSTNTLGESSLLPLVGAYNLGAIKTSLLRDRLSDSAKYNVLNHLDQPQQYKFPAVVDGWQLRRFQSSWFSKYHWLAYNRFENGGHCAYCLAFALSTKTRGNIGALVYTPLLTFNKALEALTAHEKTEYHKDTYTRMIAFLGYNSKRCERIAAQLNLPQAANTKEQKSSKVNHSNSGTLWSPRVCSEGSQR